MILRQLKPGAANETPTRVVAADFFDRRAAARAVQERRRQVNAALRPDDKVRVPEQTGDLQWWVVKLDLPGKRVELRSTIFGMSQRWTVPFEAVEWFGD